MRLNKLIETTGEKVYLGNKEMKLFPPVVLFYVPLKIWKYISENELLLKELIKKKALKKSEIN